VPYIYCWGRVTATGCHISLLGTLYLLLGDIFLCWAIISHLWADIRVVVLSFFPAGRVIILLAVFSLLGLHSIVELLLFMLEHIPLVGCLCHYSAQL
jgi:hypothetical protein